MTVLTLTIVNREEKKRIIDDTWKNEFLYTRTTVYIYVR